MKNAFYFTIKALLVLKIFRFLYWLLETIAIHILQYAICNIIAIPNISRSKDNQAMEKVFSDLFQKNQNWTYLWVSSLKFYTDLFLFCAKLRAIEIYWNETAEHLLLTHIKLFYKTKKKSGTSFFFSFSAWFSKKNVSLVIFQYLTKFHCLVAFTSWDNRQYVYCNCLFFRLWRQKFWN